MTIEQANECMWYGKPVLHDGTEYTLTAVIKRKHRKKPEWYYQAELRDTKAPNSVIIANLEKI